jgi:hypothetical protein
MNLKKILADHVKWLGGVGGEKADLQEADLQGANLQRANLQGADLQGADLQRANLDFACWPLWCGSLGVKIDEKLAAQLAYHFLAVWPDARTPKLLRLANSFHRVGEVPKFGGNKA